MKFSYTFLSIFTTLFSIPFSLFILNGTNDVGSARKVEVVFYGKKNGSSSSSTRKKRDSSSTTATNSTERIRVPIEDLNNTARYEYCADNGTQSQASQRKKREESQSTTENEGCKSWKKFIELESGSETAYKTKYVFLSKLAKYFLKTQHYLNILQSLKVEKDGWDIKHECKDCQGKDSCCCGDGQCCNKGEEGKCCIPCCLFSKDENKETCCKDCKCCDECKGEDGKCCPLCCLLCGDKEKCKCIDEKKNGDCKQDFQVNQKSFFYSLKNLTGIFSNRYMSVLESHINLPDLNFDSDLTSAKLEESSTSSSSSSSSSGTQTKTLTATTVYGFTDYYYTPLNTYPEDKIKTSFKTSTGKDLESNGSSGSSSSSTSTTANGGAKYFVNIPHTFSFTVTGINGGTSSTTKETTTTTNSNKDLIKTYNDLNEKKIFLQKYKSTANNSSSDSNTRTTDDISCLLSRNWVLLVSDKKTAGSLVKCCKTVAKAQ